MQFMEYAGRKMSHFQDVRSSTIFEKIKNRYLCSLRNLLFLVFYGFGRVILQPEVFVLVYHSVGSNGAFHTVNPEEFRRQMDYLRKEYTIVSLHEIIEFLERGKKLPKRSVAITFDDGYYDNYLNVYPYLKKHDLPATIFITTGYCNKNGLLDGISLKMLGWNEIREMSQNSIDIGAHSVYHQNLDELSLEEAKNEILESKEEIERQTGRKCLFFAYPSDGYNEDVVNLVCVLGFKGGFDGDGIRTIRKGANPFLLNRISVNRSLSFIMFKARLRKTVGTEKIEKILEVTRRVKKMMSKTK